MSSGVSCVHSSELQGCRRSWIICKKCHLGRKFEVDNYIEYLRWVLWKSKAYQVATVPLKCITLAVIGLWDDWKPLNLQYCSLYAWRIHLSNNNMLSLWIAIAKDVCRVIETLFMLIHMLLMLTSTWLLRLFIQWPYSFWSWNLNSISTRGTKLLQAILSSLHFFIYPSYAKASSALPPAGPLFILCKA